MSAGGGFQLVVSPDGEHVFVSILNLGVVKLDVAAGGLLTAGTPGTPVQSSEGIAISPDGKSLYVTDNGGAVFQFDVGPDGALSPKTPAALATGSNPTGVAVSPDGKSVYVANSFEDSVSQYSVGAGGGLTPMTPAMVSTDSRPGFNSYPVSIAVTPLARVPTSKDQCKNGGWRNFPQFKNQGACVAFVEHAARFACLAERSRIGRVAFRDKYGEGRFHRYALRRCLQLHG